MEAFSNYPMRVFYDGSCSVCRRARVGSLAAEHAGRLIFVDISTPEFDAASWGLSPVAVQKALHVVDAAGRIYVGIDAVIAMRTTVDHGRLEAAAWWFARRRPFHWIFLVGYRVVAARRHSRSSACTIDAGPHAT